MRQYTTCEKDGSVLWFRTDFLGRVIPVCPTCDEGKAPPPKRSEPEAWEPDVDERICDNPSCRKSYVPKTTRQRFCSRVCGSIVTNESRRTGRAPRKCRIASCRREFLPSCNHHIYCSRECGRAGELQKAKAWRRQRTLTLVTR